MIDYPLNMGDIGAGGTAAAAVRPGRIRLSRGHRALLWSFLDQAVVSGSGFVIGIATGRLVGIAEFGKFTIAMIFVTLALVIQEAIFATPMMTLAGHRERSHRYFGTVVVSGIAGAVALGLFAAALFAAYYLVQARPVSPGLVAATGLLVAVQCIQLTLRRTLFAKRRGRFAAAMDLGRYALFALILGALVMAGNRADTELVLWGLALSGAVAALVSILAAGLLRSGFRSRLFRAAAAQHWRIARWLVAVALVSFGQEQLLWIAAGPVLGDAAIGGLRATIYLFGVNLVLMGAMMNILPVRAAAALAARGIVGLKSFLVRFAIPFGALNAAVILAAVLPGAMWLTVLFGPAYAAYAPVLEIMAVSVALGIVRDYAAQYFRAIRSTGAIFRSFFWGFMTAILLVYPLVKALGVEGLAIDAAISQFTSMTYLLVAARRHYAGNRQTVDTGREIQV